MTDWQVITGDCLEVMRGMDADSVDSVITDPPYGLSFMGKEWDHGVPGVHFWEEALRVAKPGATLLAFGGTRTFHRLAVAIEDAGWELRDTIMWVYGSGFPKSHDISKAIDKAAGEEREVVGTKLGLPGVSKDGSNQARESWRKMEAREDRQPPTLNITAPATDAARQWNGWGTAAKPAHEPVIVAQKPLLTDTELGIIVANLSRLEAQLWLLLYVLTAESPLTLSRAEYAEALDIARWNADAPGSMLAGLQGQTATPQLELAIATSLSTVSSWRNTWEEALRHGSTFTIETATSQIIDLITLSCSASALTPQDIIRGAIMQPGSWWNVSSAASALNVAALSLNATLERFAVESAIESGRAPSPAAIDQTVLNKPILVAMKPLDGTFAANALRHGVAGLWVDGGRIPTGDNLNGGTYSNGASNGKIYGGGIVKPANVPFSQPPGRWPANVIHDGSEEVLAGFPVTTSGGGNKSRNGNTAHTAVYGTYNAPPPDVREIDTGSAARFFYCAKASRAERNAGLEGMAKARQGNRPGSPDPTGKFPDHDQREGGGNNHPTVKPLALMRYLARLTKTPTGGVVLDPFAGSGTTGCAAVMEGRRFIGIEIDEGYATIARARIAKAAEQARQAELPL